MEPRTSRPRIVIVGAGFGGLRAARELAHAPADVTVIDRSNHHLFQPLLYQVATAGLSPADIALPIRGILRRSANTEVVLGEVIGIDLDGRQVRLEGRSYPYDHLVIATGARHAYFGHGEWEAHAPGLKSIADATRIRQRILLAFEAAEIEADPERRRALLNFVIIGGGPTGTEMAGSIAELAHVALAKDFRHINPRSARIILIEAGPRILQHGFPENLSLKAQESLERLGVEVRTRQRVELVDDEGVKVAGERISARTVIWAAGVQASPAGHWLGTETDHAGRVKANPDLTIPGHPEVHVIGDTALVTDEQGHPLPGVAPVAMQQGKYVARAILARLKGAELNEPFRYVDKGSMATIGRRSAIAAVGRLHLSGALAWLAWLFVHILYLIGFRNRVAVLFNWAWNYVTFKRGARLITEGSAFLPETTAPRRAEARRGA